MEADLKLDIRETIAYPKRWTAKMNPRVPYSRYPHMPLHGANKPFLDHLKQPITWANAREEKEWLESHPKEAEMVAEWRSRQGTVKTNSDQDLEATKDANKRLTAERDSLERTNEAVLDELEAAKAELAILRAKKAEDGKLDMRTKAGREAAAAQKAAQGE